MKLQLTITATVQLPAADAKVFAEAGPAAQLQTAMVQGAKVKATVERYQPKSKGKAPATEEPASNDDSNDNGG